jgi:hypothetical protein
MGCAGLLLRPEDSTGKEAAKVAWRTATAIRGLGMSEGILIGGGPPV